MSEVQDERDALGWHRNGVDHRGIILSAFLKSSRDRFFLYFAMSFGIEGCNRILLALTAGLREDAPTYYLVRLVAYGLILLAILEKNRQGR